ncbi:MAG: hypothetical protein Q4D37_04930 [Oscillospiraceae bacterium]|nr:hypothetical protein [Oscillospiraceae bacterium]
MHAAIIAAAKKLIILLLAVGSSIVNASSGFTVNLTAEQEAQMLQLDVDGQIIEDTLNSMNLPSEILKAQVIYATYFQNVPKDSDFFSSYCSLFQTANGDMQLLTSMPNESYGLSISYDEFMRSYAIIRNVHIDKNLFSDTTTKNNIDLAAWAWNAYESQWGYVPCTNGEIFTEEKLAQLQAQNPDWLTEDCRKWLNRRTVDNENLLKSYLCYDWNLKEMNTDGSTISYLSTNEWISISEQSGSMYTLPDTIGIALLDGETVGIYVGNGEVIYAKSVVDGVVKESLSERNWTSWFYVTDVYYTQTAIEFQSYDPNIKNNLDLVQWAMQAQESGWGYVYGTYGNVLTEEVLQDRASIFGNEVTDYLDFIHQYWMGKRTVDCIGLIKSYGWYDNSSGEILIGANGMADVTANGMFDTATVKGTIDTMPEVPGLAVWHDGHIGVYIGNGEVIEAMGTQYGVVKTQLAGRGWTHWLQIPYIAYAE